ncbi:MAG: response regulator [Lachnospiraceae bacterium]|nr:response regulator [Lachnospiraceae bacterium]
MNAGTRIVIFAYQYSVVVKGIERNLANLGYETEIISDAADLVGKTSNTEVFILYLPADILESVTTQASLGEICNMVRQGGRNLILLGEKRYHEELVQRLPAIDEFDWYDRPVPADMLGPAVEKAIAETGSTRDKKRVLIVDDDPSYAGMVREWIKDHYRADIVTSGMNAITFLARNSVDLILLDYEMPVVDGPQVLQMFRQEEATAHIPVVFLTGNGTKEAVERVMSLKPDGYILKSTTRENLLGYLRKKLG